MKVRFQIRLGARIRIRVGFNLRVRKRLGLRPRERIFLELKDINDIILLISLSRVCIFLRSEIFEVKKFVRVKYFEVS